MARIFFIPAASCSSPSSSQDFSPPAASYPSPPSDQEAPSSSQLPNIPAAQISNPTSAVPALSAARISNPASSCPSPPSGQNPVFPSGQISIQHSAQQQRPTASHSGWNVLSIVMSSHTNEEKQSFHQRAFSFELHHFKSYLKLESLEASNDDDNGTFDTNTAVDIVEQMEISELEMQ
ncbi:hypothetical protein MRB53_020912 [Persea americana]|uniref:Uncharacterized protein n=1 Tax=Persea americana TaxID=3435 RepID=A0ACC2L2X6_PERAE|nr:hypothetical protein MRB53_020912 [Persea americana]